MNRRILRLSTLLTLLVTASFSLQVVQAQEEPTKLLFANEPMRVFLDNSVELNFAYDVSESQTISLFADSLDSNEEDVDSQLEVFNSSGDLLAENDDRGLGDVNPAIEDLFLPDAGVYTIRLTTYPGSASGGIELQLITGVSIAPTEGSAEACEEALLVVGDTIDGEVTGNDITAFTFCGEAGQVVSIIAIATNPRSLTQDLAMTLYDEDGNELAFDDDSAANFQLDPAIWEFELPESGLYQIEIYSVDSRSGEFTLTIEEE